MLQNAYFLAKVGADTAENEQHFAVFLIGAALAVAVAVLVPRPARAVPRGPGGRREVAAVPGGGRECDTWGICTRRAGKLYRARSRLYRSQILQVNTRWKALAEIYTMHSFAPLSNLKIFVKNC